MWDKLKAQLNILKIDNKHVCLIANPDSYKNENDFLDIVASSLNGGIDILILQKEKLSDKNFVEIAQKIKMLCDEFQTTFLVSGRVDIANIAGADGVLLSDDNIPISKAKDLLSENSIIASFCTNKNDIISSINNGADFIVYSFNLSKRYDKLRIDDIKWINDNINTPVFIELEKFNQSSINHLVSLHSTRIAIPDKLLQNSDAEDTIRNFIRHLPVSARHI